MTFANFYNQPLRQVLAEVVQINQNNHAARRTPILSATTTEVVSFAPTKVVPVVTAQVAPTKAISTVPVRVVPVFTAPATPRVVKSQPVRIDPGLQRLMDASSTGTDSVAPVVTVPAVRKQACRDFLSVHGCKYKRNCKFTHDHAALAKLKELWAAEKAQKKLEQVRSKQQVTYTKEVLAAKSPNLTINPVVKRDTKVSVAAAPPLKPHPKILIDKKPLCKAFHSPWGCIKKHCLFTHEVLPPKNLRVPTGPKLISNKPQNTGKLSKATVVKVGNPEKILPFNYSIVWKGNPNLGCASYCGKTVWKIFGEPQPSKKQIKEWCREMHTNGNFKHFTEQQLFIWKFQLGLSMADFSGYIASLPGVFERLCPATTQNYVRKAKAAFDAEEARPKYDTFPHFSEFPCELRIKVWNYAIQSGRTVDVILNQGTIHDETGGPGIFKRKSPPSPFWFTTKECEEISKLDEDCRTLFGADYFSPDFDTLHFRDDEKNLYRFASRIRLWDCGRVRRLSMPWYRFHQSSCMKDLATNLIEAFPALTDIKLLLSDSDYHKKDVPKAPHVVEKAELAMRKACEGRFGLKKNQPSLLL
ncbi:hypothetical protein DID88_007844 [Monilinia fructigena]|uniref:C3H1-type domain-containing protein n=1 Tax=Monilinia fructigena TaxID=38457 RepID=A0A395J4M3_9HELO|nr:hypothetical protein DID88_007844 [Monilinia fructigena]